jgi:hypothetical protein
MLFKILARQRENEYLKMLILNDVFSLPKLILISSRYGIFFPEWDGVAKLVGSIAVCIFIEYREYRGACVGGAPSSFFDIFGVTDSTRKGRAPIS